MFVYLSWKSNGNAEKGYSHSATVLAWTKNFFKMPPLPSSLMLHVAREVQPSSSLLLFRTKCVSSPPSTFLHFLIVPYISLRRISVSLPPFLFRPLRNSPVFEGSTQDQTWGKDSLLAYQSEDMFKTFGNLKEEEAVGVRLQKPVNLVVLLHASPCVCPCQKPPSFSFVQ